MNWLWLRGRRAHFDAAFLAQISPDQINSDLGQFPAPSGASLTGVLWQDPARDPVTLRAVADFGGTQLAVTIEVDGAGLISTLQLGPYQPPPASWAQADQELGALAPDASLLAARVSPGGLCTPVHQVAAQPGTTAKRELRVARRHRHHRMVRLAG